MRNSYAIVQKSQLPKGPFRTKNTTTIAKLVNYYAVVFLLRPPDLLWRGPFSERENVCNSQENGVRTRCAAIVNHRAIVKILRIVNLLCVVFLVRQGPLGIAQLLRNSCTSKPWKTRGSAWQPALLWQPLRYLLRAIASPSVNHCICFLDPFYSDQYHSYSLSRGGGGSNLWLSHFFGGRS